MTRLEALKELARKVEAGAVDGGTPHCDLPAHLLLAAYAGSLDAAKVLRETVLPGMYVSVDIDGAAYMTDGEGSYNALIIDNPARSWLLAILKALIAQEEE